MIYIDNKKFEEEYANVTFYEDKKHDYWCFEVFIKDVIHLQLIDIRLEGIESPMLLQNSFFSDLPNAYKHTVTVKGNKQYLKSVSVKCGKFKEENNILNIEINMIFSDRYSKPLFQKMNLIGNFFYKGVINLKKQYQ